MAGYMKTAISQEWETPKKLFSFLNGVFNFNVDLACSRENKKLSQGFTKQEDSLEQEWTGRGWLNPPYGREIDRWIDKAYTSVNKGKAELIACLIPAATETQCWFNFCWKSRYIVFFKGRIRFEINGEKSKNSQTKGTALVVFSKKEIPQIDCLKKLGKVLAL